jgi:hypothetical protein
LTGKRRAPHGPEQAIGAYPCSNCVHASILEPRADEAKSREHCALQGAVAGKRKNENVLPFNLFLRQRAMSLLCHVAPVTKYLLKSIDVSHDLERYGGGHRSLRR